MTKRKLTVGYLNRQSRGHSHCNLPARPKLVIANRFLQNACFTIGDSVEVCYGDREIIIKKLNKQYEHKLQTEHTVSVYEVETIRRAGSKSPCTRRD